MNEELFRKIIISIIIIAVCTIFYLTISKILKNIFKLNKSRKNEKKAKTAFSLVNSIIKYVLIIIAVVCILSQFGISASGIVASLGAVGVVVGLALQDVLKDILSGISIIVEDQYSVGDTITIGGFKGEVIFLGLRMTKIKAFTGEIKIISNRNITEVINHSINPSVAVVTVGVSYNEDVVKVEKVLTKLCERLSEEIPDVRDNVELLGVDGLGDSSVVFKIIANVNPMTQASVERIIKREIKIEFDKNNIEIPYNQLVIHNA